MLNTMSNEEIKTVKNFIAFLDNNYQFISKNLELMNKQLDETLKKVFNDYIEKYPYFKKYRFSPLKSSANIFGNKPKKETAHTNLLGYFLKNSEFKNYLLKSMLCLIGINEDNTIKDVICEATINNDKADRIDVLCICNKNIDGNNEIVIEAKIHSKEMDGQTKKYYYAKQKTAFAFIYLTVEKEEPQCDKFINITWIDLVATFYAGYNSYKYSKTNEIQWHNVDFEQLEDSNDGIFFQMWLSNILTYFYYIVDIDKLEENDYEIFNNCARFMEQYHKIMESING